MRVLDVIVKIDVVAGEGGDGEVGLDSAAQLQRSSVPETLMGGRAEGLGVDVRSGRSPSLPTVRELRARRSLSDPDPIGGRETPEEMEIVVLVRERWCGGYECQSSRRSLLSRSDRRRWRMSLISGR